MTNCLYCSGSRFFVDKYIKTCVSCGRHVKPTQEEKQSLINKINEMSHYEMCSAWRFSEPGNPIFCEPEIYKIFKEKFDKFGGFTPEISKSIGWKD